MKECINKNIQILMSTYNGEKYLKEQLDSFVNLEGFENTKVLIRDDGSTDSTLDILYKYKEKYDFEIIEGYNVGVNMSMSILFNNADKNCEFFALSDQDDVWISNKFTKAIRVLELENKDVPLLFATCSEVVNCNLESIGSTIIPNNGITFYNAIAQNVTPGHTQVFNKSLMEKLTNIDTTDIHVIDWWIYLIASGLGKVLFINDFTVKHRQHGNNAVGYQTNKFKKNFRRIKSLKSNDANSISRQLYVFNKHYGKDLNSDYENEIVKYFKYQKNFLFRIKFALITKIYRQSKMETMLFKILYIVGKYNMKNIKKD